MLPESIKRAVAIRSILGSDDAVPFECLSLIQIKQCFANRIAFCQVNCEAFKSVKQEKYYVVRDGNGQLSVVSGKYLLEFMVGLPTDYYLKEVTSHTVSVANKVEFSVELEKLFTHEVNLAERSVREYERTLSAFTEIDELAKPELYKLMSTIHWQMVYAYKRSLETKNKELAKIHKEKETECRKQIVALQKYM